MHWVSRSWKAVMLGTLALVMSAPVSAERFAWFGFKDYEGWVEDTGTQVRVKVVPYLLGPDSSPAPAPGFFDFSTPAGHQAPKLEFLPDGRLKVPYRIVGSGGLPQDAMPAVAAQSGVAIGRLVGAPQTFVRASYDKVVLEIYGDTFEEHVFSGASASGDVGGAFYIPADRPDLIEGLATGNFRLVLDFRHPVSEFSSLVVNLTSSEVSSAWMSAFREIVRTRRTSGGKFLFLDFSSTVSRSVVREAVSAGGNNTSTSSISIELRDPTPEMLARAESVLGFAKISREDMLAQHRARFSAALAAANPRLAQAHKAYLDAHAPDVTGNNDQLIAALGALKDGEPLAFLAAGFQMRDSSSSSYYRYDGTMVVDQNSQQVADYREYLVTQATATNRYFARHEAGMMRSAIDEAYNRMHGDIFQVGANQPMQRHMWALGVVRAIDRKNVASVHYAMGPRVRDLVADFDADYSIDSSRNRFIHRAARTGNEALVRAVLAGGASPSLRNNAGDRASDLAGDAGNPVLANFLRGEEARSGTVTLELSHPNLQVTFAIVDQPSGLASQLQPVDASSSRLRVRDYPRRLRLSGRVQVQANLPLNQCGMVRFEHVRQNVYGGCTIVAAAPFSQEVRIREDGDTRYVGDVVLESWQTGFRVHLQSAQ